jgi:hypothetical protein
MHCIYAVLLQYKNGDAVAALTPYFWHDTQQGARGQCAERSVDLSLDTLR